MGEPSLGSIATAVMRLDQFACESKCLIGLALAMRGCSYVGPTLQEELDASVVSTQTCFVEGRDSVHGQRVHTVPLERGERRERRMGGEKGHKDPHRFSCVSQ